ncbi:MAG: leader peptidase (prepilin peptidase) / N-methyltransferase [Blastocatellia bacterium]|nr:leader peptidase (prepilin peptidase) / N-methyltransferase [Blastocatellia bacterium]
MLTCMNLSLENPLPLPLPVACALMGVLGAIIGSFLNVVIHRLPREQSIVFPNSSCPKCHAKIKAYDNIPILSFLILRGQCRGCGAPISPRYPAVEALTALLFVAVTWHDGWSFALGFDLAFAAAILALIFIDAEHMILPNAITYPGILFALITRAVVPYLAGPGHFDDLQQLMTFLPPTYPPWVVSIIGAAFGALVGGGSLWLMGFLWEKLRGVEAMGLGDVKMMFMVGAYLGWRLTILTILMGALSGSLIGVSLMLRRGSRDLQMMLPFGIFLGIGSLVSLLFGTRIIEWYTSQFY